MDSPPRIRRVTRRTNNRNVSRRLFNNTNTPPTNNSPSRRLFQNTSNISSGIRNNPHYISMEQTPERIVNQYTPRSRNRHNERTKRRAAIQRERHEAEVAAQERALENARRREHQALLRKGTPTKLEQRESRKRPRTPNNTPNRFMNNNNNYY